MLIIHPQLRYNAPLILFNVITLVLQQVQRHRSSPDLKHSSKISALGSRDDATASADDLVLAEKELQRIEVEEPLVEEKGENAAGIVAAAVAFGAGVWAVLGQTKGQEYFAGYLLEQSLSIDNLFVFILVFKYFKTPVEYQSKVLSYGIWTAAVLRLVLIVLGVDIVERFEPVLLLFAAILIYSSLKLLL